MVLVIFHIAT